MYGTGKMHVRYGNCISFLQFPPRSQGSADAKEEDFWQFAWQDTSSRAETSFKSLQFSRTSICGSKPSKMACCAIRWMPCGKSLISTPSYPVPSVFSHSTSRSATKIRCQGLFAANKEPPCQDFLKFELWMKKYETSIGSIENSQTLPTQDEKKDETCTNEYAWIWSFSQWLYPVLGHGGVCRLGRRLGIEKARTSNAAFNCRLCPLCRSPLTYDYGILWLNTHLFSGTAIRQLSSQCPGVSQMSPEVLPPPVLQDVPLREPKKTPNRKSKWGREKKTWNGECVTPRTGYNSHVDIWYCGQLGFMVDVNTHPHCLAKGVLPYSFLACYCCYCLKHSCRLPLIMVASHVAAAVAKALKSRRSMCCPAQSSLQQAPCFHPWAQTAINWSNSVTDVTEVTGGMEYQPSFTPSSRVGNKKHLRAGDFFFQTRKSFP